MEYATPLPGLSFTQKPRRGQQEAFEKACEDARKRLNCKLPTGYGKSYVAAGTASILHHAQDAQVNRIVVIVPTENQHDQFIAGLGADFAKVGLPDAHIIDFRYLSAARVLADAKKYRDKVLFFVTTIQTLAQPKSFGLMAELLRDPQGRWMICVDEYHHYGDEKAWSRTIGTMMAQREPEFLLAMSATPYRPDEDGFFGEPEIIVTYDKAVEEHAVKPLKGHCYEYLIEVDINGEPQLKTTRQIIEMAGGDSPANIERIEIENHMRWRADYISPLLQTPLRRMEQERLKHGLPLQAVIGALSVSHARSVCAQVELEFPHLRVDWVGTGPHGRRSEENIAIMQRFCPLKPKFKIRPHPTLDVLVHVGIAGEGMDSPWITEIVHLNAARMNNQNNQENGRAARFLASPVTHEPITGNVNFDGSSDYKAYTGDRLHAAMDMQPPEEDDDEDDEDDDPDHINGVGGSDIDENPVIVNFMELEEIDSGDPNVQIMMNGLSAPGGPIWTGRWTEADREKDSPEHAALVDAGVSLWREVNRKNLEPIIIRQTEESIRMQINIIASNTTALAMRLLGSDDKDLRGRIKTEINRRRARQIGRRLDDCDEAALTEHYRWTARLHNEMLRDGVPAWLAHA